MEEINKFLTEEMGLCWHNWLHKEYKMMINKDGSYGGMGNECSCGFRRENRVNWTVGLPLDLSNTCKNIDFSTWDGFGKLWEWAKEQEWYIIFCREYMCSHQKNNGIEHYCPQFKNIDPDLFANALYEFLKSNSQQVDDN